MAEMDVKTLIARLRTMHGHVGRRDKETVVAAIGALTDLSVQLFSATHLNYKPKKGGFELRRVDESQDAQASEDGPSARPVEPAYQLPVDLPVLAEGAALGDQQLGRAREGDAGTVAISVQPLQPDGLTPQSTGVLTDIQEPDDDAENRGCADPAHSGDLADGPSIPEGESDGATALPLP